MGTFLHSSEAEPKGSDCYEAFSTMQECMAQYPTLYNKDAAAGDDDDPMKFEGIEDAEKQSRAATQETPSIDKEPAEKAWADYDTCIDIVVDCPHQHQSLKK